MFLENLLIFVYSFYLTRPLFEVIPFLLLLNLHGCSKILGILLFYLDLNANLSILFVLRNCLCISTLMIVSLKSYSLFINSFLLLRLRLSLLALHRDLCVCLHQHINTMDGAFGANIDLTSKAIVWYLLLTVLFTEIYDFSAVTHLLWLLFLLCCWACRTSKCPTLTTLPLIWICWHFYWRWHFYETFC